jgi:DNA primase
MDAVEEVKSRINIEDVIGEYVQLKRAGRNWKGLSPFSEEHTPSFMVSPEKQIWHDFSSGRGGNVFSFIMEVEGLDFKGALELLARKAGVDLEQYRTKTSGSRGPNKERLYELLDLTAKFYQVHLSRNRTALEYVLGKRKFSKETVLEWRLGYSPNSGQALINFLRAKGFKDTEMKAAGVTAQRYRGVGDMFRGRVMIPLCDPQGRVIGFTARLLADDPDAPKYINTPQTVLYDKSRHVFGLHLAKEMIRKSKFVVVAEGNLDVISSHQAGVRQVVATAGTALTEQHLQALSRFTGDIRLSFDADKAGLNATERAIPIASKAKVSLSIISIPSGKDPDELIKQDPAVWQKIIQSPQYALDWLIERYQKLLDIKTAVGKREFSDVILNVVRALEDPVEQEHYVAEVAKIIAVSQDALRTKMKSEPRAAEQARPRKKVKATPKPTATQKELADLAKTQNRLLSLALMQPRVRIVAVEPLTQDMMLDDSARQLLQFLHDNPGFDGDVAHADTLRPIADYVKILGLHYEELYQGLERAELYDEAARLQAHLIDRYVKMQKQSIAHRLQDADEAETKALLEQARSLDTLLKAYKGGL